MRTRISAAALVILWCAFLLPSPAEARVPKKYQVTGKVVELTSELIVIDKGDEKWEIARDASTKVTGELKVGSKVTIEYRMTATNVDVKKDSGGSSDRKSPK